MNGFSIVFSCAFTRHFSKIIDLFFCLNKKAFKESKQRRRKKSNNNDSFQFPTKRSCNHFLLESWALENKIQRSIPIGLILGSWTFEILWFNVSFSKRTNWMKLAMNYSPSIHGASETNINFQEPTALLGQWIDDIGEAAFLGFRCSDNRMQGPRN